MNVAIIGRENNSGLEKDKKILTKLLMDNGIAVTFRSIDDYLPLDKDTDICLFTEVVDDRYYGKKNILIPNQEWFHRRWLPSLENFDSIFCKSHFAVSLFREHHRNVVYTGFTSLDLYSEEEKMLQCFHSQGQSNAKGTPYILEAWEDSSLPLMHVVTSIPESNRSNLIVYDKKLSEAAYIKLINQCLIHICPSMTEGFGHCINEAKSCGAVVITTNFPPMNEIISSYLVPADKIFLIPDRLGYCATVNPSELNKTIKKLIPKNTLLNIGRKNRQDFLKNDRRFGEKFLFELMKV